MRHLCSAACISCSSFYCTFLHIRELTLVKICIPSPRSEYTFFCIPSVVVTTTIRLRFDGRSTAYQRSLRSQWRNPLAAITLIYLFRPQCSSPHLGRPYGRNVDSRMVVARSNCSRMGVERRSNLSGIQVDTCNHRLRLRPVFVRAAYYQ